MPRDPLLLCAPEFSWAGSAGIHFISCLHSTLNTVVCNAPPWHMSLQNVLQEQWVNRAECIRFYWTLASFHPHAQCTWRLSSLMQSYDNIMVLKCHIVWSIALLEVMCCTIPIVLKWPFRAACMWLRQQQADQERKSAIACLLLSGMLLSATEVSTKDWWRKRWL